MQYESRSIVYKVTNLVNHKIYIGKTSKTLQLRKRSHYCSIHNGTYFHHSLLKYGKEAFLWEEFIVAPEELLSYLEQYWILSYETYLPDKGYNRTFGGEGYTPTIETRIKISERMKGAGNHRFGVTPSDETRIKISQNNIGKHSRYPSEESKQKMSNSKKGKTPSNGFIRQQHKNRVGKANPFFGKKHPKETLEKIATYTRKPVRCIELDKTFKSITEASRETGVNQTTICRSCKGTSSFNHRYHWEYIVI